MHLPFAPYPFLRPHMTDPDLKVEVAVAYALQDYKRVLRDFFPIYLRRSGKKPNPLLPWNWPLVQSAMFATFVPLIFWWKKSRIGDCAFTFCQSGLSRTSRGHTAMRTWAQVETVHCLSGAYLIELKEGGAMPVPF